MLRNARSRTVEQSDIEQPTPLRSLLAILVMLAAVVVVYWPPNVSPDHPQLAFDYTSLHSHRMRFAQDSLFGPTHSLPAWYPRELLGTPFWSNVQNFPFIPTRLLILFTLDPDGPHTYAIAVILSACLSALFTYWYCRKLKLGAIGSASAGWTFAASGFYASRIAAGHLPLLEAYCSLPLVLWAVESVIQSRAARIESRAKRSLRLIMLGASTCFILLAGHPQLPIYAMFVAAAYLLIRSTSTHSDLPKLIDRIKHRTFVPLLAMIFGAACASFALIPMSLLAGRSTRILALDPPANDLAMPYARLAAWWFPWADGAPNPIGKGTVAPFTSYPTVAYFWDTVVYTGWMPWLALSAISILTLLTFLADDEKPDHRLSLPPPAAMFLVLMSLVGCAFALPWWQRITSEFHGTFLRSPARLSYLVEMGLAFAFGIAIDRVKRLQFGALVPYALPVVLIVHGIDLFSHDRAFIIAPNIPDAITQDQLTFLKQRAGDGRVAIDTDLNAKSNRLIDDVGFFDSIMLARSYKFIFDLNMAPEGLNIQNISGSQMSPRALAAAGVVDVATFQNRPDLPADPSVGYLRTFNIPNAQPRAAFFRDEAVRYLDRAAIHAELRNPGADLSQSIMLPIEFQPNPSMPAVHVKYEPGPVSYTRDSSDRIHCVLDTMNSGYLRVIESFDPGWSATVDGKAVPIVPAQDALLAVAVPAGHHDVVMTYHTYGATAGIAMAIGSVIALIAVSWFGSTDERNAST